MKVCISCTQQFESSGWQCPFCGYAPRPDRDFLSLIGQEPGAPLGFSDAYFSELFKLESRHFWFRARNHLITWGLASYFPQCRSLLEIGCGTGYVLSGLREAFPDIIFSGGEPFSQGLILAKQRSPEIEFYRMDAHAIPFVEEFDVIGAFDVLEHIKDDMSVLRQIARATKPGGGILVTVPQHPWLWSIVDEHAFHHRRYRRLELIEKVQDAGYRIVHVTSFVSLLLPFLALSRLKYCIKGRSKTVQIDEFNVNPFINKAFKTILAWERRAIKAGISFGAGGSLFLVAIKQ